MQKKQIIPSIIRKVNSYRHQALVERDANFQQRIDVGITSFLIADLSPWLRADSVRIACSSEQVNILEVNLEPQLSEHDGTQLTTIDEQIQALNQQNIALQCEENSLTEHINRFEKIKAKPYQWPELPEPLRIDKFDCMASQLKLADFISQQLIELKKQRRMVNKKLVDLQAQLQVSHHQRLLQSEKEQQALAHCRVAIHFQVETKTVISNLQFTISYLLPNVFWSPNYELHINSQQADSIELVLKASVMQRSGEDWLATKMNFSTANLLRTADCPKLDSWRIGATQTETTSGWRMPAKDLDHLFSDYEKIPIHKDTVHNFEKYSFPDILNIEAFFNPLPEALSDESMVACVEELTADFDGDSAAQSELLLSGSDFPAPLASKPELKVRRKIAYTKKMKPIVIDDAPTAIHIKQENLYYQNLCLHGPNDKHRGRLQPIQDRQGKTDFIAEKLASPLKLPEYGHFSVSYPMAGEGQVLANGVLHQLTLLRQSSECRHIYRCIPALDNQVYHYTEFENPFNLPLLEGEAEVYVDGNFTLETQFPLLAQKEKIQTNLGVEANIVVARNVYYRETNEGLFKGETALIHNIEIKVRSCMTHPVVIEIIERIPSSLDEHIRVKITKMTPLAIAYDQKERHKIIKGGQKFSLHLSPMEEMTCLLEYQISLPAKKVLQGGNRRV